jgi:hypothetical protein
MEGRDRLCGTKKKGQYLIDHIKKKELPKGATSFLQVVPTLLNKKK